MLKLSACLVTVSPTAGAVASKQQLIDSDSGVSVTLSEYLTADRYGFLPERWDLFSHAAWLCLVYAWGRLFSPRVALGRL